MLTIAGVDSNGNERNPESVGVPPVREASAIGKKSKKCSGKINPKQRRQQSSGSKKDSRRRVCSRVFRVFHATGKHTQQIAGFRVCSRFSGVPDNRQACSGFRVFGFAAGFSGVPDDRQTHSRVSGFRQSFGFCSRFIFRSSEGSDSDLDTLDKNKQASVIRLEKNGSTGCTDACMQSVTRLDLTRLDI